ncbi:uncharacterized protein CCOS01_12283 [Colletotrichum costaricense]|uniref:Carboxylic ester hydrolase n=1 Tax=Colletotrichum costaricense TaxID=1209916 RepID=A0AAI9YP29_9PEZI|nr:uncharacterized protein CCOS01_12283 [Colletotrichum costaricense]KAK1518026.1 hypothetical protein CCOS01_12283 [Colletotrichum costaricense]
MALAVNGSRCASATFGTPILLGASILAVQANLVEDYSFDVPKGWTYSQPALDVENATFCNVTVTYTHPGQNDTLTAEAWLPPIDRYNGILQSVGGGGWNPGRFILSYAAMINAVANGYATVTTDAGIPTTSNPIDWLLKSPGSLDTNALQNFGQVSLNDEAIITKQLIESFYGKPPARSYWNACSQGGRQGLKLAQQYPDAYDGIMSAAPAVNWAEFYLNSIWPSYYMLKTQQFPLGCELNAITALAISACDELDGVKDGLVSDPEACRANFNVSAQVGKSFTCAQINSTLEISEAAANVAIASWTGPRSSTGRFIYDGYEMGSDLSVIAPTECTGKVCTSSTAEANVAFAWQAFVSKDPNATVPTLTDTMFDTIHRATKLVFASNMETDEADLSDFKNAGGKIITYHGLADQSISPGGTLRYYNTVSDVVGGNISSFYKYYRVPGLEHCWGGRGGQPEALFAQLRAWVENGTEPESSPVIVTLPDGSTQEQVLCPYPQKARFDDALDSQCDEVKPKCGQCSKALHNCSFESSTLSSDLDTPANASHDALNRGQSSKYSKANESRHDMPQSDYSTRHNQQLGVPVASSSSSTLSHTSSPGSSTSAGPDSLLLGTSLKGLIPWIWTVDDLALLHHFLTCPALDHGDAILWRQKVPLLAFENHSVLHLLLAVSAFHLATIKPDERTRYRGLADKHYEAGLRQTMELMPRLSLDSAGVLYIATTLICSCSFARGPAPGNLLIVSDGVEVAWFELLKGVRLVIETVGFEAIFSGVLAPTPSEEKPPPRKDPSGQASVSCSSPTASRPVTWEHALGRIAQLIADTADPDEVTYRKMIQYVSSAFQETFGTFAEPTTASEGKMEVIMACIYRTDDDFVRCLKMKKTIALVVLGHFAVLVKKLEWLWYMRGWADQILQGVASNLDAAYLDFLQWPRKEIERLEFATGNENT